MDWIKPKTDMVFIGSKLCWQPALFGVWNTELGLEHFQMEQLDFPHEIGQTSDTIHILQYI